MFLIRYYKPIDCGSFLNSLPLKNRPKGNISASHSIRIILMPTNPTSKQQTVPIGSFRMPTDRTPLTTVGRINQLESNAFVLSLVGNKELGFGKRPTMDFGSKFLALLQAGISNIRQVFHHDGSGILFNRPSHQPLGGKVQNFLCYGILPSCQPLEEAAGTRGANTSNSGFGLSETRTLVVQGIGSKVKSLAVVAVGSDEDVFDAAVNPNKATVGLQVGDLDGNAQDQIPLSFDTLEFGIRPFSIRDWLGLILELLAPDRQPTAGQVEVSLPTNGNCWSLEGCQFPSIIGLGCFVGRSDLTEQRQGDLAGQFKLFTNRLVKLTSQFVRVLGDFAFKDDGRQPVGGFLVSLKDLVHPFGIAKQLEFHGSDGFVHTVLFHYTTKLLESLLVDKHFNPERSWRQFCPDAKDIGVSLPHRV